MQYAAIKTLKQRVKAILQDFEDTRNSDITLTIRLWNTFYPDKICGMAVGEQGQKIDFVALDDLFKLPREDNIKRCRAYWQNTHKLFPPTVWEIAKKRGMLKDEWRVALGYPTEESAGTDKPKWNPPSQQ